MWMVVTNPVAPCSLTRSREQMQGLRKKPRTLACRCLRACLLDALLNGPGERHAACRSLSLFVALALAVAVEPHGLAMPLSPTPVPDCDEPCGATASVVAHLLTEYRTGPALRTLSDARTDRTRHDVGSPIAWRARRSSWCRSDRWAG